jgi:hypothetical protein
MNTKNPFARLALRVLTIWSLFMIGTIVIAISQGCPPPSPPIWPQDADAADIVIVDTDSAPSPFVDATPPPAPNDAASDAPWDAAKDQYDTACANLLKIGCLPEAAGAAASGGKTCAQSMRDNAKLYDMKPACLAKAADVNAARMCGTVKCAAAAAAK